MRVALDFDKTLAVGTWPHVDYVVPGAAAAMRYLHRNGHHITVWSCRNNQNFGATDRATQLQRMKDFLDRNQLPYDAIDYGDQGKLLADLYVDDKALGVPLRAFRGEMVVDWPNALQMVRLLAVGSRL